jgi:hypothetical protein
MPYLKERGFSDDLLAKAQADLSDGALDRWALEADIVRKRTKPQFFQTKEAILAGNPDTGKVDVAYDIPEDPLDQEYRQERINALQALAEQREASAEKSRRQPAPRGGGGRSAGPKPPTQSGVIGRVLDKVATAGFEALTPGEKAVWGRYNKGPENGGFPFAPTAPSSPSVSAPPAARTAAAAPAGKPGASQANPVTPKSRDEAAKLPKDTWIRDPKGNVFRKAY